MSENEENRWVGPFVLGFLLGVLLCLGGGGAFVFVFRQRAMIEAEEARRRAAEASMREMEARAVAEHARREAEEHLRQMEKEKAEKAKGKE